MENKVKILNVTGYKKENSEKAEAFTPLLNKIKSLM